MNKAFSPPRKAVIYTAENDGRIRFGNAEGIKEWWRGPVYLAHANSCAIADNNPELRGHLRWADSEEFDEYVEQLSIFKRGEP